MIVIIHPSRVFRDCLKRALSSEIDLETVDCCDYGIVTEEARANAPNLIIAGLNGLNQQATGSQIKELINWAGDAPVVVTGDSEEPRLVAELLLLGVRGYLPSSLDFEIWVHTLRLVLAGGVFAPASCLLKLSEATDLLGERPRESISLTEKQAAVVEAIRRGKANKTIAYELNMCESTVKVHVRTIMKKLKAKNRTEVAFIASQLQRAEQLKVS